MRNLMIVESPNKIKTILKILKKISKDDFILKASNGHILNLPTNDFGVTFNPDGIKAKWVYEESKQAFVKEIMELAKTCDEIYLATDLDREGERIALDIIEKAKITSYKRITFNEITEDAIKEALKNFRHIDLSTANTAITRRIIDRVGGYGVSSIMKFDLKKQGVYIPDNIAVGRSQSPALKILATLEKEIEEFIEEDYLRVHITYQLNGVQFTTTDKTRYMLNDPSALEQLKMIIQQLHKHPHVVNKYSETTTERRALQPLITSTMQSSAFNLFGFKAEHTMKLAKDLFEKGGYITYIRTDSNTISNKAYLAIIEYLYEYVANEETKLTQNDILESKAQYKQRKNSQEAHECIRPSYFDKQHSPDYIKEIWDNEYDGVFGHEHFLLYQLIWYRTISTQLKPAYYDDREIIVNVGGNLIEIKSHNIFAEQLDNVTGEYKQAKGWLNLKENFLEASDSLNREFYKQKPRYVPKVEVDQELVFVEIKAIQDHTRAPYRYGEGRFIDTLEKYKIARPSTIATIIPSLESKGLITRKGQVLEVEKLGLIVNEWISNNAPWLNSLEEVLEFDEKLEELENSGDMDNIEIFAMKYNDKVEELKERLNITDEDLNRPTDNQIEYAKSLANQKNITLSDDILKNKDAIAHFIKSNTAKLKKEESYGSCPECKKGRIYEKEKSFSCDKWKENSCSFTLWKDGIFKFFQRFGKEVTEEYVQKLVGMILHKEEFVCQGLSKIDGSTFTASIILKKDEKFGWGVGFGNTKKVLNKSDVIEQQDKQLKEIKEKAEIDGMTRLFRKEKLFEDLEKVLANNSIKNTIHLAFVDGDRFKGINDNFGHDAGDEVLKYIARNLLECADKLKGKAYRYGGEEFVLVCSCKNTDSVINDMNILREAINFKKITHKEYEISVSVSIGLTPYINGDTAETLIKRADQAVYQAKENGRNTIVTNRGNNV